MKRAIGTCVLFLALTALSGCLPTPHGDAWVADSPNLIGRGIQDHGVELSLPAVSLSKTGTTWVKVRNLPPYQWENGFWNFWYDSGEHSDRYWGDQGNGSVPDWPLRDVVVTLTLREPHGQILSSETYRFADAFPGPGSKSLKWAAYLDKRRDYDIGVTVIHPAPLKHATLSISAATSYGPSDRG